MVYLIGLLFLVFCHEARQSPVTNDRPLPAEEFLIYVGNETRMKRLTMQMSELSQTINLVVHKQPARKCLLFDKYPFSLLSTISFYFYGSNSSIEIEEINEILWEHCFV